MYLEEQIADLLKRVAALERENSIPRCPGTVLDQIRGIQTRVAIACGVELEQLLGESRLESIVWPRQVAMFLVHKNVKASTPLIGGCFHRDHSTILHGVRTVKNRISYDASAAREVQTLEKLIVEFKSERAADFPVGSSPASAKRKGTL